MLCLVVGDLCIIQIIFIYSPYTRTNVFRFNNVMYCYVHYFFCRRHLAQKVPAEMAAAAYPGTRRIIITVRARRAIQVFIAREVNNKRIFIYSHAVFNISFLLLVRMWHFYLKKLIKTVFALYYCLN